MRGLAESRETRRIFLLAIDSKLRFLTCADTSLRKTVLRFYILNSIFKLRLFFCFLEVVADECPFLFELCLFTMPCSLAI